jgi:hypothetical protein
MLPTTLPPVDHHQARSVTRLLRVLRDEFVRQVEVEL